MDFIDEYISRQPYDFFAARLEDIFDVFVFVLEPTEVVCQQVFIGTAGTLDNYDPLGVGVLCEAFHRPRVAHLACEHRCHVGVTNANAAIAAHALL